MMRIRLEAWGTVQKFGTPTVVMVTGDGAIHDGKFCLTSQCVSDSEIDGEADWLCKEIEEWRKAAKKELAKRKRPSN